MKEDVVSAASSRFMSVSCAKALRFSLLRSQASRVATKATTEIKKRVAFVNAPLRLTWKANVALASASSF